MTGRTAVVVYQWRSLIPLSTVFAIMPLNSYETLALLVSRNLLFGPVFGRCVSVATRGQHCLILNRVEKRWALFIFTNKEWQIQVKKKNNQFNLSVSMWPTVGERKGCSSVSGETKE